MKKIVKNRTIDDYINIGKSDIVLYLIISLILLIFLLCISFKFNDYFFLFFEIIMLLFFIGKLETYINLKKFKKHLIDHNIYNKIGKIDYFNEKDYFLTNNYMIIKKDKQIYSFKYTDIKRIFKINNIVLNNHSNSYYQIKLYIITNNNEFEILIYSTILVDKDYMDISDYLLNKNPNIEITEEETKTDINI